ncbi:MAG: hypothetical protein A9183_07170 [Dehalococcoides mccartyi]|uniref:DEAD/DEAH box helicase n=1 Tax=Dehalococcoides mccartyi TaxID=61435 RepID=UPI0008058E4D|nr:DEAD/DEAH box helicase [Dehalococcoides mccartyi]OBW63495.1 MAG: hypothetical protein A9183_07170 [Dehalococcoides mccartyi]
MFSVGEIRTTLNEPLFKSDLDWVHQSLAQIRLKQDFVHTDGMVSRLSHFVECVLSSAPSWDPRQALSIFSVAAEIAELLSRFQDFPEESKRRMRIRSALLYEFAELPVLSSAILESQDLTGLINDFFHRNGFFASLNLSEKIRTFSSSPEIQGTTPLELALSYDALRLAEYEQGVSDVPSDLVSPILAKLANYISLGMSVTELKALALLLTKRTGFSTRANIGADLFQQIGGIQFPAELWPSQVEALRGGLIDPRFDSWGFAAPTGTGKTFLARLLIIKTLTDNPDTKILYVVPSKALVYEVSSRLAVALQSLNYKVISVTPQLIELDNEEETKIADCSVAVLTPEKADMLLRLNANFMPHVSLIIIDEAHHIESGSRGVLLELYLWRIKRLLKQKYRMIFLSAVAPNIVSLARVSGQRAGGLTLDRRPTRMRAGVYRFKTNSRGTEGWIEYSDNTSICVVSDPVNGKKKQLIQLAEAVSNAGPVLIVAEGKQTCETLSKETKKWLEVKGNLKKLSSVEKDSAVVQRLDSRLAREMHEKVEMRDLVSNRIAYHHAGLPPRVRTAVEDAIRENLIDYVFATTTLSEGVNFPFSSVIVQSLALREPPEKGKPQHYHIVTPRSFWNIAGRAGRPGYDREGQAILFEPSLGLNKVNAVIGDYLNPSLSAMAPVRSALAENINRLIEDLKNNEIKIESLSSPTLPLSLSKEARGTINLLRVGIIHAKAFNLINSPEEILEGTFASQQLDPENMTLISRLIKSQAKVVDDFMSAGLVLDINTISQLGISLETLTELRGWVASLENWQIESFGRLMYGGEINFDTVPYVVGPVAARMAELEGPKLGGFYSSVIVNWLSGFPLMTVKSLSNYQHTLEDLISVIYSRVQYLLPWGLYATHELLCQECRNRGLTSYNDEVLSLAYLVDAGVPNFDALRLIGLDFERVDASRLSKEYKQKKSHLGVDIIGWLATENRDVIVSCVRGTDNRRLDYDFFSLLEKLSSYSKNSS